MRHYKHEPSRIGQVLTPATSSLVQLTLLLYLEESKDVVWINGNTTPLQIRQRAFNLWQQWFELHQHHDRSARMW